MDSSASASAKDRVFRIPELLESIVSLLDMKTILVSASRVSKQWSIMIVNSPKIQQILHFQPMPPSSPPQSLLNPLLVEKFGDVFFDLDGEVARLRSADSLFKLPWAPKYAWGVRIRGRVRKVDDLEVRNLQRKFTRHGASWRRMLVSQPPPPFLGLVWFKGAYLSGQTVQKTLLQPVSPHTTSIGVTMGQLYDICQHSSCISNDHPVWFKVHWNTPRPAFPSLLCRKACSDLLEQTNVVVEIHGADYPNWQCGPFTTEAIRGMFQCEDIDYPNITGLREVPALELDNVLVDSSTMDFWPDSKLKLR